MAQPSYKLNFTRPPQDPFVALARWMRAAQTHEPNDPLAASLATVDAGGAPNWRMVLVKAYPKSQTEASEGFVFFTNISSAKAQELQAGKAALGWHWKSLRYQLRVRGTVRRLRTQIVKQYFATRTRASQLSAWASQQSAVLASDTLLRTRMAQLDAQFAKRPVPCPDFWVGYALIARQIEFWQDGADRLHHRLLYKKGTKGWQHKRLFP